MLSFTWSRYYISSNYICLFIAALFALATGFAVWISGVRRKRIKCAKAVSASKRERLNVYLALSGDRAGAFRRAYETKGYTTVSHGEVFIAKKVSAAASDIADGDPADSNEIYLSRSFEADPLANSKNINSVLSNSENINSVLSNSENINSVINSDKANAEIIIDEADSSVNNIEKSKDSGGVLVGLCFLLRQPTAQDLVPFIKLARELNASSATVFCGVVTGEMHLFVKKLPIELKLYDLEAAAGFLNECGAFPELEMEEIKSRKRSRFLSQAFVRKRSRQYFFSAAFMLLTSFIAFFPLYYIISSSVLFLFSLYSRFNSRFNGAVAQAIVD